MGRIGTKRSDRRWEDEEGNAWASKLEATIYFELSKDERIVVRRCERGGSDTFDYTSPVSSAVCLECGSTSVVQRRKYTPDLYVTPKSGGDVQSGYYIEIKGHFPGPKRTLLRHFLKTGPSIDLRMLLQRDGRATRKLNMIEYITKYMNIPVHVWDGQLQKDWYV